MSTYATWYEFKKELEKRSHSPVLNSAWLRVKPASPLPWNDHQLRSTASQVHRLKKAPAS